MLRRLVQFDNTSVEHRVKLYCQLGRNVASFVRFFGTCIVIDMAHSVMRIIFSAYFLATSVTLSYQNFRGIVSDAFIVAGYFYLVFMICRKGSKLESWSGYFVQNCGRCDYPEGEKFFGNDRLFLINSRNVKMKRIWIATDYFRVNLGLIAPVSLFILDRYVKIGSFV